MLTERDLEILFKQSAATLADWWCHLNRWDWPIAIPDPEPMEAYPRSNRNPSRRRSLLNWIEETIGTYAISRQWNLDMTDQEFNDFYRAEHCSDVAARQRDHARRMEKSRITLKEPAP